jgi:thiopurine S-methyltransferase
MRKIMDKKFWKNKWDRNEIAFHQSKATPLLVKHFKKLSLKKGSRVFLPLCGKTLDIAWLMSKGFHVVGVELVELAIQQLFNELGIKPAIHQSGELKLYSSDNIDIFVGNFFKVRGKMIKPVDAVFDRAAIVALPEKKRVKYAKHLQTITKKAPQLLITFDYNQDEMSGPPFSVNSEEVKMHYGNDYEITLIESNHIPNGLKGSISVTENIWLLYLLRFCLIFLPYYYSFVHYADSGIRTHNLQFITPQRGP